MSRDSHLYCTHNQSIGPSSSFSFYSFKAYDAHLSGPNYYQRLQLTRDATLPMIKKAFKKLSLELHPDKNRSPDAVNRYLSVKTAYEVLIDSEKRDIYNRLGQRGLEVNSKGIVLSFPADGYT